MDIFLLAVLVVSGISGARKGLILTVKSFLGWFLSVIPALILCNPLKSYLISQTGIDEFLSEGLNIQLSADFLPDAIAPWLETAVTENQAEMEIALVSMLMSVISFLLILAGIKLAVTLIIMFFSKEYHDGAAGFIDGILGLVAGLARGVFYILLIFVIFIPLFSLWMPDFGVTVSEAAADSLMADAFYNHNILLTVLEMFSGPGNSI